MIKGLKKLSLFLALVIIFSNAGSGIPSQSGNTVNASSLNSPIIADHTKTKLSDIPAQWINNAKSSLTIAYGHTSHGSQLVSGMDTIRDNISNIYDFNNGGNNGAMDLRDCPFSASDLGNPDRTAWAGATRSYLNSHPDVNVIMWSWCGQVSSASNADIDNYLSLMSNLENEFPNVYFVYMTGHTDGSGLTGNLHVQNSRIRQYCQTNNKILFDFEDIESYDPSGNYYGDKLVNDACDYDSDGNGSQDSNWARNWQDSHTQGVDWFSCDSAHSEPLNANLKGYACWYLWARLAGWNGTSNNTPTPTAYTSSKPTNTPTYTPTSTSKVTPTNTRRVTATNTPVVTPTYTSTNTIKNTSTPTITPMPTSTYTPTNTAPAGAQTIRIESPEYVTDTFLMKSDPSSNYGSNGYVGDCDSFLIKFTLPPQLANKRILSGKISFYVWNQTNWQPNQNLYLYELKRGFDESSANWNQSAAGINWTNPGGDYDAQSPVAAIPQLEGAQNWDHTFYPAVDITESIRKWNANPETNLGFILVNNGVTRIGFKASEYSNGSRPYIQITYDSNSSTTKPTSTPTSIPTNTPTSTSTSIPTSTPTNIPTNTPTNIPTNTPTNTSTPTNTYIPTSTATTIPTPITHKILGYIAPDHLTLSAAYSGKSGFKIEISNTKFSVSTDENGHFELLNIPTMKAASIKISKNGYLLREITNLEINKDIQIGTIQSPVTMIAGDIMVKGEQDGVINFIDVMEIAKCFGSISQDSIYNISADFNLDNSINMADVVIMATNFNKTSADYNKITID